MSFDVEGVNRWLDNLLDGAIQETNAQLSNEHIWELGHTGNEPNPHAQNIANRTRYKELLQAIKATAKI